jgi:hypothetical protein
MKEGWKSPFPDQFPGLGQKNPFPGHFWQEGQMRKVTFVLRKVGFGRVFSFPWRVLRFPWEAFIAPRATALGAKLSLGKRQTLLGQRKPFQNPHFLRYEITISNKILFTNTALPSNSQTHHTSSHRHQACSTVVTFEAFPLHQPPEIAKPSAQLRCCCDCIWLNDGSSI